MDASLYFLCMLKPVLPLYLKANSLVKRTKLIRPHFNTMDKHSIKRMPIYWFRGMHKRKDLNLSRKPLTANLKIDRRLVIDHKWQEIHLSFAHFSVLFVRAPTLRFFHTSLSYILVIYLNSDPPAPCVFLWTAWGDRLHLLSNHVACCSLRQKSCQ